MSSPTWNFHCTHEQWPTFVQAMHHATSIFQGAALSARIAAMPIDSAGAAVLVRTMHKFGLSVDDIGKMVDAPRDVIVRWILGE